MIIQLNDGFGADGNAMFTFRGAPRGSGARRWIQHVLPNRIEFATPPDTWAHYAGKLDVLGGVVKEFLHGPNLDNQHL
ncbi:hypothetical protein [Streptomyces paromomycinus]|uniref:Uncharacterized protein n=1 Tax=Streptomyces paromomycinus TaxID=92743 RepID=A0A401WF02_STREY|nr:hypothetical protein [Streptomyces paromomycinus]GCD47924.1 hypothetical protein GKJPGBOP_07719 [Streptomyces paromomycinus]